MRKGFGLAPSIRVNRSRFDLSHSIKTTMSVGKLYPIDIKEVLPGDTFSGKMTVVCNVSSSFIKPVIDNLYMDIHHFFIPNRLLYDDAERIFGNPSPSAYEDVDLAEFPTNETSFEVKRGSVGDYLGIAPGQYEGGQLNVMPFRCLPLVWNYWYRNENVQDEVFINKTSQEFLNTGEWSPNCYTDGLPNVCKKKDYFTSALPKPQKGDAVDLIGGKLPVRYDLSGLASDGSLLTPGEISYYSDSTTGEGIPGAVIGRDNYSSAIPGGGSTGATVAMLGGSANPSNLVATTPASVDINLNVADLRYSNAVQTMLEADALYGTRYNEYLLGRYGIVSPDSRLQIPEYIGGGRIPIQIQRVAQTSQSTSDSPLANVAGYSQSVGFSKYNKGFVEHGYVLTCACIRQMHTYQQGVPKMFLRHNRNQVYDPMLANISEQPIFTSELYVNSSTTNNDLRGNIFGYQEAWGEYRYSPSVITGQLRSSSDSSETLDVWHFGDYYSNRPYLNDTFVEESSTFVNRTLSVPSTSMDNFIVDVWHDLKAIRAMPTMSRGSLIVHK